MDNQANVAAHSSRNDLPVWDLTDLYDGLESSDLTSDLEAAESTADVFARNYMGKLATLDPDEFGSAIHEFEDFNELLSRIMSYAQLLFAADSEDGEIATFYQNMSERVTAVSAKTLFFELRGVPKWTQHGSQNASKIKLRCGGLRESLGERFWEVFGGPKTLPRGSRERPGNARRAPGGSK